jgi:Glutathione-dependent formaldehyde-activating enzyme
MLLVAPGAEITDPEGSYRLIAGSLWRQPVWRSSPGQSAGMSPGRTDAPGAAATEVWLGSAAMAARDAACHCGQLRLEVAGDPFAVSICSCLACQRRTGSAFGMQATFKGDQVRVVGRFSDFARISDEADRKEHVFHFCPP